MKHVLSILVQQQPEVLARITGTMNRKGFAIHSLAVGTTEDPAYARITVTVEGETSRLEQLMKQLEKVFEVRAVQQLPPENAVCRDLAMIKVAVESNRAELLHLSGIFRADVIDASEETVTFGMTGEEDRIDAFVEMVKPYGIIELVRTGIVGLARRACTIHQCERSQYYYG